MNPEEVQHIGIVGAGLMGHGIALQFALSGYDVALVDTTDEKLRASMDNVRKTLEVLVEQGLVEPHIAGPVPDRIHPSVSLADAFAGVDFVVEAVFEDLGLKQEVFADLDRCTPEHATLTSNTSSFMTSQLAPLTRRPEKVVVANWWNPPYLLPLIEVVRGPRTSDETVELITGLFSRLGKKPVVLQKESLGFIGNRMQFALLREALSIVAQGIATPEDVDAVVKTSFGRRLAVAGPLEVFDIAGWDTIAAICDQLFPDLEKDSQTPDLVRHMVERGDLGVKSGQGFYKWDDDAVVALRRRITRALASIDQFS